MDKCNSLPLFFEIWINKMDLESHLLTNQDARKKRSRQLLQNKRGKDHSTFLRMKIE